MSNVFTGGLESFEGENSPSEVVTRAATPAGGTTVVDPFSRRPDDSACSRALRGIAP